MKQISTRNTHIAVGWRAQGQFGARGSMREYAPSVHVLCGRCMKVLSTAATGAYAPICHVAVGGFPAKV